MTKAKKKMLTPNETVCLCLRSLITEIERLKEKGYFPGTDGYEDAMGEEYRQLLEELKTQEEEDE